MENDNQSQIFDLIRSAYRAFNARDIDGVLALMAPDVDWANGMDGGRVHGQEAVRAYWTQQWAQIDPHVEPVHIITDAAGQILVDVDQVVCDRSGKLLDRQMVQHVYTFKNRLI